MKRLLLFFAIICVTTAARSSNHQLHIQHFDEKDGFSATLVQHAIQDSLGYIWLATWDGLRRYDGYRFRTYKTQPGDNCPLETNRISYIEEDVQHNIICFSNDKFYLFNRKTERFELFDGSKFKMSPYHAPEIVKDQIRNVNGFETIEVNILLIDSQQGVWVYSHRGLERITLQKRYENSLNILSANNENVVSALYVDHQKRLWISDKQGYISIRDKDGSIRWLSASGVLVKGKTRFGYAGYHLYEDSRRNIWIGCKPGGLFRLEPSKSGYDIHHYTPQSENPYSINSDAVYYIGEDSRHRMILATYGGGLNIAETRADGTLRFINSNNLLKTFPKEGMKCRCLWLNNDDILLLGTNDGIYCTDLKENYKEMRFYINHRHPDKAWSISNNYVVEILRTRAGELFVATSGGGTERILSKQLLSDTLHFQHYSVTEGISSDMNQSICEDPDGNVWIISARSISLLAPKSEISTNYWHLLSDVADEFTEATPSIMPDSSIVLGTTQGVLMLSRQQMAKSSFVPRIVFDCEQDIRLLPDNRNVTIRFAALDYNKTEEIIYAYMMEGIDPTWRYTRSNELNYVKLSPGTYVLHVKSTNGEGVWVENEETVVLHCAASFNETPYAWMLYGLLLSLAIAIVTMTIKYIRTLKRELKGLRFSSKEQIEAMGSQLKDLLSMSSSIKEIHEEAESQMNNEDRIFAQNVKKFISDNIDNADLSVIDMAQAMNVSRTVLFVRMRQIFDSSPNNYILNTRINYARQLLLQPNVRVSEVAFKSGFSDPKYFSRCFKKLTGYLPKEYAEGVKSSQKRL